MKDTKLYSLISWAVGLILALFFMLNGLPKITPTRSEEVANQFESWGYSAEFAVAIGILEILGGVMVLIPRVAFYGALILIVIMVGAVYTHISTGIGSPVFAIFLLILAIAQSILTKRKALLLA